MSTLFLKQARETYIACNTDTLNWVLARGELHGGFLNTKKNSINSTDYTAADGLRAPAFSYGWIQGRGLESLITHAEYFAAENPVLSAQLFERAKSLYSKLNALVDRDGKAYFCYDAQLNPILAAKSGLAEPLVLEPEVYGYADAFVAKGLIAAAYHFAPENMQKHLSYFDNIIASIEANMFQMDERVQLSKQQASSQDDDFGPRMILLGSANLLRHVGADDHNAYVPRFVHHVMSRHFDNKTNLLSNIPMGNITNPGHSIEFVGFVLDYYGNHIEQDLFSKLETLLISAYHAGYKGPGITISLDMRTGEALSPYNPWWSLPETIRSSALAYKHSQNPETLSVWQKAHDAFFNQYWREDKSHAYQTLTAEGPFDYVPATPDLDPGYHTGLSLLAAIRSADYLLRDASSSQAAG